MQVSQARVRVLAALESIAVVAAGHRIAAGPLASTVIGPFNDCDPRTRPRWVCWSAQHSTSGAGTRLHDARSRGSARRRDPKHLPGGQAPVPSIANASFLSTVTATSDSAREACT